MAVEAALERASAAFGARAAAVRLPCAERHVAVVAFRLEMRIGQRELRARVALGVEAVRSELFAEMAVEAGLLELAGVRVLVTGAAVVGVASGIAIEERAIEVRARTELPVVLPGEDRAPRWRARRRGHECVLKADARIRDQFFPDTELRASMMEAVDFAVARAY